MTLASQWHQQFVRSPWWRFIALWLLTSMAYSQTDLELSHRIDPVDQIPVRILPDKTPAPEIPAASLARLEQYWLELISDFQLPGAAIGIVQQDGLVTSLTVGKRIVSEDMPIDADTLFNLGEATLAFTTLLAATSDRPDFPIFDRRASTVHPLFRMTDRNAQQQCRIRDLFTMTAGAPPYTDQILDPQWAQPEDVFALLGQAPVMSPPGDRYRPSKISATIAGYLSVMAMGDQRRGIYSNYIDVAQSHLMEPLKWNHATFSPRQAKENANRASGHQPADPGFNPIFVEEPERNPLAPLLGLKISLNEATRWLQTELSLGLTPDGKRIAAPVSVRERWQPAPVQNTGHRGMGWTRRYHDQVEIIESQGSYGGQSAAIGFYPAYRTGFIVFCNAQGPDAQRLLDAVTLGLAEIMKETRQNVGSPAMAIENKSQ